MADTYEQNLAQKTNLTTSDYIRVVGADNVSYKQLVSDVAKKIIETYTGSSLAGSAQSVKAALDSLNSKTTGTIASPHTLASGQCYLVKCGNIVYLTIGLTTTSAVSNYGVIATIPSGFRPYGQLWGRSLQNRRFDITASGNIRTVDAADSGENYNLSVCYVVA